MQLNIKNQEAELIKAIELQEALQRLLTKERAKHKKLEEENAELKRRNDELRKYKSLFKRRRKDG